MSLEKFMRQIVDLLDTIAHVSTWTLVVIDHVSVWTELRKGNVKIAQLFHSWLYVQSVQANSDIPMLNIEDLWHNVQGPTSLVELALEQKQCTVDLVSHHYNLCTIMYAMLGK